jgi:cell wall assembly regulator SMI1
MIDHKRILGLLHKVPRPPEQQIPKGATDAEIGAFEARMGLLVPDDLRQWLRVSNAPCVGPGGLFGIGEAAPDFLNIESILGLFPAWQEKKWIPVAGDGCGNYYVVPTQHEFGAGFPVVFVESICDDEAPAYIVASDLGHFLIFILERELGKASWPFDEKVVVHDDPAILKFDHVSLPWRAD